MLIARLQPCSLRATARGFADRPPHQARWSVARSPTHNIKKHLTFKRLTFFYGWSSCPYFATFQPKYMVIKIAACQKAKNIFS